MICSWLRCSATPVGERMVGCSQAGASSRSNVAGSQSIVRIFRSHAGTTMPLSEDEQRILAAIEEQLTTTDPSLAEKAEESIYRDAARNIRRSALVFVLGFLFLLFTFTTSIWLGFLGFLVMLGAAFRIEFYARSLSKAGLNSINEVVPLQNMREYWRQRTHDPRQFPGGSGPGGTGPRRRPGGPKDS